MKLRNQSPALLLIDIQKGMDEHDYYGGNRNNLNAELKAALLLKKWRELQLPVFHIQHRSKNLDSPLHPSNPGFEIKDVVKPFDHESVIVKEVNSAFIGTDLNERLDKAEIKLLVIVGLTTNHCVSTTVRMAANLGYEVLLISDATATFNRKGINGEVFDSDIIHYTALASLKDEFAEIIGADDLINLI